jgi:hypothetical protein
LEILLSNISLKEALQCQLDPATTNWMLDPNLVLDRRFILGRTLQTSRPYRSDTRKRLRRNSDFTTSDYGYIRKCYSFYFGNGTLSENMCLLDVLVKVFRILAMFARQSENSSILEVIYKFLPTFEMPGCDLVSSGESCLVMENWLLLVEYSVVLGFALNQQLQQNRQHNKAEFDKCLELTITYALSHARKVIFKVLTKYMPYFSCYPLMKCWKRF